MKFLEEFEIQVNSLKGQKASLDWKYLSVGRGLKKFENIFQALIGRIIFVTSVIFICGIFLSEFQKGYGAERLIHSSSSSALYLWMFVLILLYSLYLARNRANFLDKARHDDLYNLKKKISNGRFSGRIEISDYFNHNLIWLLDFILNISDKNYLVELSKRMHRLPRVVSMVERLGISTENFDESILIEISSSYSKTAVLKDILFSAFIFSYESGLKLVDEQAVSFVIIEKFYLNSLLNLNVFKKDLEGIKLWIRSEALRLRYINEWKYRVSLKPKTTVNRAYTSRYTPTLNANARDFTSEVIQGDFTISLARENELAKLITILEKGDKSAVLIVGEPGVGKTTLVKYLAVRMVVEDVPKKLQDKRLVGFDFNKAFTSSKNPDEFKGKLRSVMDEVAAAGNVILVLDNVNQLLNLRQEISGEIANILVDSLDTKNIRLIASTDRSQYIRFIRPHKALSALFTQVEMPIPPDEVASQIVFDEIGKIESEYGVKIAYNAVKAAVELSHKFSYDRVLPDKAIDLLKEVVVNYKHLAGKRAIEYDEVAKVVSSKVGVNLGSITQKESERLKNLEEEMHKRVIDQNEAIDTVCDALRRSRSGLSESGRPIASYLFFGPTGVGKTEVAKTVAQVYYGSESRMVRIDMSEYHEDENLKRLIGFTADNGSFEGGFLTEQVYTNPYSLVLLDEIDKAAPKVLDLFLQVLDEGHITDGLGRSIDFSNTIVIATSNAGSSVIAKLLESGGAYEAVKKDAIEELKKVFRIEFLNRFDKVIMFKPLGPKEVRLIAKKFVDKVGLKLLEKGIKLVYNDPLLDRLAKKGFSPVFGAREMRRVVQEDVENKVADMIVAGKVKAGGEADLTI